MPKPLAALIVEDSEDDALLVVRELRRGGYEVTTARVDTAGTMQAALAQGGWDVVIADYAMPQFSGLAALRALKDSGLDLPFIIVSGAIGEDVAVEAMRAGAHDYLMKGNFARLVPAVERELREAEVRRERRRAEQDLHRAHAELERRVEERTRELAETNTELRREIAERQRTEVELQRAKAEAEAANHAKDHFLGVLSHELRTPLAPVLLTASALEKRPDLPADARAEIETISRNVTLEARIIDDLLDLTRVARGKLQFDFRTTDLHLLIRNGADICGRGEGAKIDLALSAKRHSVHGDAGRLQQVFWNLLINARKFTRPDGRILVRSANAADGRITVEVTDTGVGIEPRHLGRIFDAFEQGNNDRDRQFGGLGLGLAICKAIVDAHGGTIRASSAGPGRGATFTVELRTQESAAKRKRRVEPASPAAVPQRALRILLVEDDASLLRIMSKLIPELGHQVQTATSVAAALDLAGQQPFDLVISDLGLPDGSGHDLMRMLKQRHGLRGIALSGYGMEEDIRHSLEAGFAEHLTKPIEIETLDAAIKRTMGSPPPSGGAVPPRS